MSLTNSRAAARSPLLGREEPRLWTRPLRELTPETSLGFEAVKFAETILGRRLYPWQRWFLIHSLELAPGSFVSDEFPRLRYRTVLLMVARQNGKSFILLVRMLWRLFMWDGPEVEPTLVLGVANKRPTAFEIMQLAHRQVRRSRLRDRVSDLRTANGDEQFSILDNDARWRIDVPSDDGGRGFSVTDLAFDELRQQADWAPWSAVTNTTNARFSSQVLAVSNAGTAKSAVLRGLREQGLQRIAEFDQLGAAEFAASRDTALGMFEWSAPEGCDLWDREGWLSANPSMGHADESGEVYLTEQMLAAKVAQVGKGGDDGVPEHVVRTENLCQWVVASREGPFPEDRILACVDDASEISEDSPIVLAVDTSHDRGMTYLAVAGYRMDGLPHVEVIAARAGTEWVAEAVAHGLEFEPDATVVQGRGAPASSLIAYLSDAGVDVTACQGSDLTASCSQLADRLMAGTLRFRDDQLLMLGFREAEKKTLGEVWVWNRKDSPVDVAPLCAATEALWGLEMLNANKQVRVTAYGDGYDDWWKR